MSFLHWQRSVIVRFLLNALPLFLGTTAQATTYYVSPTGNDASSGTTQAQAWATITRVNQLSYSLQPGDQILFQRGGTYRGALLIASAGTAAQPITIGAYGSGAKPVLTGAVPVAGWSVYQGDIWVAPMAQ